MPNKIKLSVFIITKNEEDRVATAINSVKDWVDEIIIIDSGSSDNTEKIVKKTGAKFIYNKWQGFGPQKKFGEKKCKNEWILNIDADEEVTPKLAEEITSLFNTNKQDQYSGYYLRMLDIPHLSKNISKFAYNKKYLRLYNKKYAGFKDSIIHDSVTIQNGKTSSLQNFMIHRSIRSYAHAVEKFNYYSDLQAENAMHKQPKLLFLRIITTPFTAFFKNYFLRRYCFFGVNGLVDSIIYAFSRCLKFIKIRESLIKEKNAKK
jgi:glycosyltransferase involved in cell wall biosynthesis